VKQGGLAVVCLDGRKAEGQRVVELTMPALQAALEGLGARAETDN
jgi:hypothetical protein